MNVSNQLNTNFSDFSGNPACENSPAPFMLLLRHSSAVYLAFVAIAVTSTAAAILAILLNGAIIAAVLRTRQLRELNQTVGLVSLAFADLAVGILVQPVFIAMRIKNLRGFTACDILEAMDYINTLCSGLRIASLTVINVERFLAIYFPYRYKRYMSNTVFILSLGLTCIAVGTPRLLVKFQTDLPSRITATLALDFSLRVLMWSCSIAVCVTARRHRIRLVVAPTTEDATTIEVRKAKLRDAKHGLVLCSVTLLNFVSVISLFILHGIGTGKIQSPSEEFRAIASPLGIVLGNMLSVVNPIVYGWTLKRLREAMRRLFTSAQN
ncbi:predicted protein [Nematostella vectensis]|uniref:G-protein coupled receptors family 1 profile domain-containing protein n=1 Tax=Nematostella vectensis TaxID=45351 RepID=A7SBJ7_NEMVE|nr:predicted protein [Nematostella vectensis]|eukprot:XP_001630998.1 predicted protein [Nematostella vectensis]